ncbi:PepSY domain-containing protein [Streptococcus hyovaginalis]|uniref:PepSY domain-containing protein n=1 Tax=Streptococcus hyovaginalis TaxID=149015 RepID=UPI003AED7D84
MKKLIGSGLGLVAVAGLAFGGYYVYQQSQFQISESKAVTAAMRDANLSKNDVTKTEVDKEIEDGMAVYEIDLTTIDGDYDYVIDGKTGDIISRDIDRNTLNTSTSASTSANQNSSEQSAPQATPSAKISADQAKEIALKDANRSESDVTNLTVEEEIDNGKVYLDVSFDDPANNRDYSYDIDGETGAIVTKTEDPLND